MTDTNAAAILSGEPQAQPAIDPAAPTAQAAADQVWYKDFQNEGVRTWVEAKGFKDPSAVAESAYNLEKLMGFDKAGKTIVIPGEDASPEERASFNTKLGVPATPDEYKLPVPDGQSDEFAKTASKWFHENGVPAKAAVKIAEQWNEMQAGAIKQHQEHLAQQSQQDWTDLKSEWAAGFDKQVEMAKRACSQFIPAKDNAERGQILAKIEDAIGTGAMMRLFASIGSGLGEHRVVDNGSSGSYDAMTPAQAKQRIEELKSNKDWTNAYLSGDKAKAAEMEKLSRYAAGLA